MRTLRGLGMALGAALLVGGTAAVSLGHEAIHASAAIVDTSGASIGWARLVEDATGTVHVSVHVRGLTPGRHGIHLHAVGACTLGTTPPFSAAGGHHDPLGRQHGLLNAAGPHPGDLPNLQVNAEGIGRLAVTTDHATLAAGGVSLDDANGSAIVIHAAEDDQLSQPIGGSGARVACGVLVHG